MNLKKTAHIGIALAAAAAFALPGAAQAAQPGQTCNVNNLPYAGANVYFDVDLSNPRYWLNNGAGFTIVSYGNSVTYWGRGNGLAEGYFARSAINQSSCHW